MRSPDHHAAFLTVFGDGPQQEEQPLLERISDFGFQISDLGLPSSIRNGASSTTKFLPCLDLSFLRVFASSREKISVLHALAVYAPATELPLEDRPPEPMALPLEQQAPCKPPSDEQAPPLLQAAQERLSRLTRAELALGVGLSLWLHLAVLLGALLLPGTPPCAAPETHFVMVSLLDGGAGGAGGTGWFGKQSGHEHGPAGRGRCSPASW